MIRNSRFAPWLCPAAWLKNASVPIGERQLDIQPDDRNDAEQRRFEYIAARELLGDQD